MWDTKLFLRGNYSMDDIVACVWGSYVAGLLTKYYGYETAVLCSTNSSVLLRVLHCVPMTQIIRGKNVNNVAYQGLSNKSNPWIRLGNIIETKGGAF